MSAVATGARYTVTGFIGHYDPETSSSTEDPNSLGVVTSRANGNCYLPPK